VPGYVEAGTLGAGLALLALSIFLPFKFPEDRRRWMFAVLGAAIGALTIFTPYI